MRIKQIIALLLGLLLLPGFVSAEAEEAKMTAYETGRGSARPGTKL